MNSKKILFIILTLFALCVPSYVFAEDPPAEDATFVATCEGYFGSTEKTDNPDPAYYLQQAFTIIKYAGIIICIGLSSYEFLQEIFKEEKDGFKGLAKKTFKRLIIAMFLFFLPDIVDIIMGLIDSTVCGMK